MEKFIENAIKEGAGVLEPLVKRKRGVLHEYVKHEVVHRSLEAIRSMKMQISYRRLRYGT